MRLKSLSLKNFRCFTDELIEFDAYTAIVGANNTGKSAIIAAIEIFFNSNPKNVPLSIDDFFKREKRRELEIGLTFSDLGPQALEDFGHYARSGLLTFFTKGKIVDGSVVASLHGMRFANPRFARFFEMTTAGEKREFYERLPKKFKLPDWKNQHEAAHALNKYENENPKQNIPIQSAAKAFGVEGPIPRLRRYIDFVHIPAVKDASDEAIEARNTAFTRLVDRAVRANLKIDQRIESIREKAKTEIDAIAQDHRKILAGLANKIENQYQKFNPSASRIHLNWGDFDERSLDINLPAVELQVSDDLIKNPIQRFGHGTQRNYLIAILLVSASYDFTSLQTMIIACEEPELYQHPPQARILSSALSSLISNQAQVVVTTHSPYFITAKSFESIRVVRRTHGLRSKVYAWSIDENSSLIAKTKGEKKIGGDAARAMVNQFLQSQINEMFFAQFLIFVEGEEDRSLLNKYLQLTERYAEILSKGVHVVPVNGKGNMINALAIARGFEIPAFAVVDGDMGLKDAEEVKHNVLLNKNVLALLQFDGSEKDGVLKQNLWGKNFCFWSDCLQNSFGENQAAWDRERQKVCEEFGWSVSRLKKNPMVLEATLERFYNHEPIENLEKLCNAIFKNLAPIDSVR